MSDEMTEPRVSGDLIRRALADCLRLRMEMKSHDLSKEERLALMAAAMPAFIEAESRLPASDADLGAYDSAPGHG